MNGRPRHALRWLSVLAAVAGATAAVRSAPDADHGGAIRGSPVQSLLLRHVSMDVEGAGPAVGSEEIPLRISFTFASPLQDGLAIYVSLPEGYELPPYHAGDRPVLSFRGPSDFLSFRLRLQRLGNVLSTAAFPLSLVSGERRIDMALFVRLNEIGLAAVIAPVDEQGEPVWQALKTGGTAGFDSEGPWWLFHTTTTDAMAFAAELAGVQVDLPNELKARADCGIQVPSIKDALVNLANDAACKVEQIGRGAYVVGYAEGFRGAADGSWWLLRRDNQLWLHAENAPVQEVMAALMDLAKARMAESPVLSGKRINLSRATYTISEAIQAICAEARLTCRLRDGIYSFDSKEASH